MAAYDQQSDNRKKFGWRSLVGVSLLVLIGGLLLAGWVVTRFDLMQTAPAPEPQATSIADAVSKAANGNAGKEPSTSDVAAKVEQLEERLEQIDAEGTANAVSNAGGGNSAIATALRMRRAIENGTDPGIIGDQMQLRFGDSNPQAVSAILAAVEDPVTLTMLRDDLVRNESAMMKGSSDDTLWGRVKRELSEIFVIRQRGTLSRAPSQILQRAGQNIGGGDVQEAIDAIEQLPDNAAKRQWLEDARRYVASRDALDAIERTALTVSAVAPTAAEAKEAQNAEGSEENGQ